MGRGASRLGVVRFVMVSIGKANRFAGVFGAGFGAAMHGRVWLGRAGQGLLAVGLTVGGGFRGAARCGTQRRGKARFFERHNG